MLYMKWKLKGYDKGCVYEAIIHIYKLSKYMHVENVSFYNL